MRPEDRHGFPLACPGTPALSHTGDHLSLLWHTCGHAAPSSILAPWRSRSRSSPGRGRQSLLPCGRAPAGPARLGGAHEPPRHQLDRRSPGTPVRFRATLPNRKCRRGISRGDSADPKWLRMGPRPGRFRPMVQAGCPKRGNRTPVSRAVPSRRRTLCISEYVASQRMRCHDWDGDKGHRRDCGACQKCAGSRGPVSLHRTARSGRDLGSAWRRAIPAARTATRCWTGISGVEMLASGGACMTWRSSVIDFSSV